MWGARLTWAGGGNDAAPAPSTPPLRRKGLDGGNSREPVSPGNDFLCNAARLRTATYSLRLGAE